MSLTVVLTRGLSQSVLLRSSRQTLACIHNAEVARVAARAIRAETTCCMTLLTFGKLRVYWVCSNNLWQLAVPRMETTWVFCRLGLLFSGNLCWTSQTMLLTLLQKLSIFTTTVTIMMMMMMMISRMSWAALRCSVVVVMLTSLALACRELLTKEWSM